jgi:hypothetical protein
MYLPFVGVMLIFTPDERLESQYVPDVVPHEKTVVSSPVNDPVLEIA